MPNRMHNNRPINMHNTLRPIIGIVISLIVSEVIGNHRKSQQIMNNYRTAWEKAYDKNAKKKHVTLICKLFSDLFCFLNLNVERKMIFEFRLTIL